MQYTEHRYPDVLLRQAHWLALAIGGVICALFLVRASAGYELWFDELCTLFFSDPAAPLSRTIADTHPPVYYLSVRLFLALGLKPKAALWGVNFTALGLSFLVSWRLFRDAKQGAFAIAIIGLIVTAPGTLRYLLEGRNYTMAQAACLVLTAAVLTYVEAGARPRSLALLPGLSLLCAGVHIYAGLFAGAIGGALFLYGLLYKDRSSVIAGLAVGGVAAIVTLAWTAFIYPLTASGHPFIAWLGSEKTNSTAWNQVWFFLTMTGVRLANVALLAAALALCALAPAARRYTLLFVATAVLFVATPAIVSIVKPMLTGRYLLIAIPSLLMIAGFAVWRAAFAKPRPIAATIGALAFLGFAGALAVFGPDRAYRAMQSTHKPYSGAHVAVLLAGQPPRALRVKIPVMPDWGRIPVEAIYLSNFNYSLDRSDVRIAGSLGPPRDVQDLPSGLIGWSEDGGEGVSSPEAALFDLGLTNRGGRPLRMERTIQGYLLFAE